MKLLDTDGDGCVNFDEFLIGVRVSCTSVTLVTAGVNTMFRASPTPNVRR